MLSAISKRMKGEGGFTLIELLVVIIIIAILAAIAIPTFLGQRDKANDTAARSLVRNGMTAVESAYVDNRDFGSVTLTQLNAIEPSITWITGDATSDTAPDPGTLASDDELEFYGGVAGSEEYYLGTLSKTTTPFGVYVDKTGATPTDFEGPGW